MNAPLQRPDKHGYGWYCVCNFCHSSNLFFSEVSIAFMLYNVDAGKFSETAMQLIYCKCRCVSFWIYIFLNSISKVETKVDVLSIIYVDACWNISDALSAAWNWFFNLNLKLLNINSKIWISMCWGKSHQWFVSPFLFFFVSRFTFYWYSGSWAFWPLSFVMFSKIGTMWTTNSVKTSSLMVACFLHTSIKY